MGRRQRLAGRGLGPEPDGGRRLRHAGRGHRHPRPSQQRRRRRDRHPGAARPSSATRLASVLLDDALRLRLGQAALERARTLTWDATALGIIRVLHRARSVHAVGHEPDPPVGCRTDMRSVIVLPTYNEGRTSNPSCAPCARRHRPPTCSSSTTTAPTAPGRIAEAIGSRTRPDRRAAPCRQARSRQRLPGRFRPGARTVPLRRRHLDGCRLLARSRAAERVHPAGRRGRRRGDRLALRARRRNHRLAGPPPTAVEVGQRLHPGDPRLSTPATARAATGPTGRRRWRRSIPPRRSAEGYAFLTELVRRLTRDGATVVETPIIFRDRTRGKSKMSGRIIVESMMLVTAWGLLDRWRRLTGASPSR